MHFILPNLFPRDEIESKTHSYGSVPISLGWINFCFPWLGFPFEITDLFRLRALSAIQSYYQMQYDF